MLCLLLTCFSNTGISALVLHRPHRRPAVPWAQYEAQWICVSLQRPRTTYQPFARGNPPASPHARYDQRWTVKICQIRTSPCTADCPLCCRWIWSGLFALCGSRMVKCRCRVERRSLWWRVCAAEHHSCLRWHTAVLLSLWHTQLHSPHLRTSLPALYADRAFSVKNIRLPFENQEYIDGNIEKFAKCRKI